MSASPAAGAQAQAQVRAARRPPGMRQDARVQILDRRSPAPESPATASASTGADPASAGIQGPTVQLVERPRSPGPAGAASPFTIEQMMLIGHLLDRYLENTLAIQDTANAALAEGALIVLAGLLPAPAAPPPPAQDSAPLAAPTPAVVVAAPVAAPSPTVAIAETDDANAARRSRRRPRGRGAGGHASAPSEGSTPAGPPSSPEGPSLPSDGEPSTPAAPSAAPEKM
ncbi:MAG: hypothetical protein E6J90_16445 [Deltaproteobacteria bacterium]|nr:MAG: hypothetical protein E6J91_16745 [Deltaproteobacteria bacterium]TMQ20304.1 MAG: hypothetical protein E6J90_16445 [Deltaproteobacteria bacterium]